MSLPSGYKRREYIQSSGTQYIDTGFKPNNNTKVVIDFELTENTGKHQIIFGARSSSSSGQYVTTWTEGAAFSNYQALDTSMEARRAEKEGVTSVYSALVDKAVPIEYGDYFRDTETGTTYRVTSNPEEKQAPRSASFTLKYFTAERKELPA